MRSFLELNSREQMKRETQMNVAVKNKEYMFTNIYFMIIL